jgi:glucose dehydrogenase
MMDLGIALNRIKGDNDMTTKMWIWLIGMFIAGGFLYSIFGLQILITKNCALKLHALLASNAENWYPEACLNYWKKVIRSNTVILLIASSAVVLLVPLIGAIGFFAGMLLKRITAASASRATMQNLEDSAMAFAKFAKPGKEDAFTEEIFHAAYALSQNPVLQ